MTKNKPKIVCFSCNFGWGYQVGHVKLAEEIPNLVPVACSGKVDSTHILESFKSGADGVLILGCPESECHYQDGNYQTRKKVLLLKSVLTSYGIEPERLRMVLDSDPEGKKIPGLIAQMAKDVEKLGPVKILNSVCA
jgi:F420-non-reducing hydrogenase iron-sulfur subunit